MSQSKKTAYDFFVDRQRATFAPLTGQTSPSFERSCQILWKGLSKEDKEQYFQLKNEEDVDALEEETKANANRVVNRLKQALAKRQPKPPIAAYNWFFLEQRGRFTTKYPDLRFDMISAMMAKKWEEMEPWERRKYEKIELAERESYDIMWRAWNDLFPPTSRSDLSSILI